MARVAGLEIEIIGALEGRHPQSLETAFPIGRLARSCSDGHAPAVVYGGSRQAAARKAG